MSTTYLRTRVAIGLAGLFCGALLMGSAVAQQPAKIAVGPLGPAAKEEDKDKKGKPRILPNTFTDAFSLEIDRDASNKIEAVREYLKRDEDKVPWNTIVEVLQKLLESPKDTFIEVDNVDAKTGSKTKGRVSIRVEVNRLIGTFPPQGRQFYQLAYGQEADVKLKKAIDENDKHLLAEVAERYLHTKAGAEATVRLGTWRLDRGQYMMAAQTFQKLQFRSKDEPLPPHVLFQAALAFKRLGEPGDLENAEAYWKKLKEALAGKNELVMGPKKLTLEQLEEEYKRAVQSVRLNDQSDWYMGPGGRVTRNGRGIGGRPFLDPRFPPFQMCAPWFDEDDQKKMKPGMDWIEQNLKSALQLFDTNRAAVPLPAFFPVATNGRVIFRAYDGVYCVATKEDNSVDPPIKVGEKVWRVECDFSLYGMVSETSRRREMEERLWPMYRPNGPYGIFFENGLIGSLSHDGTNVYFVDDMAVPPHPAQIQQFAMNGQPPMYGPFADWVFHNRLVAVNIETGKLVWKAGERSQGAKPEENPNKQPGAAELLTDCHFLSAPLPLAGKLYVIAEKERELLLICLDPSKIEKVAQGDKSTSLPEVLWYQPLGSPNHYMPTDTMRRIQGIQLAYSDGILVCPTNAGAILGVDLLSHSLVWAHSYREPGPQNNQPDANLPPGVRFRGGFAPGGMPGQPGMPQINEARWHACAPMIATGKVVFTAYDAGSVQCLDLRSGELLWTSPRAQDDLYVAGIFEDRVMVVGKSTARFLNLNSRNKDLTAERIGRDIAINTPAGIGTASGNTYYLPVRPSSETKEPQVWSIDVLKGEVTAKTSSRKKHPIGNLMFFEGDVFSQSPFTVTAFPQLQVKKDDMRRRLAQNPNDPLGLTEMGELQLDDGERLLAIDTFKKALGFNPPEATRALAREKLYEAITELLQHDFGQGENFLDEYKELCNVPIPMEADALKRQQLMDEELNRKSKAYFLIAEGREKQGKLLDAFENYMAFGRLNDNRELVAVPNDPTTTARPDVLARARIDHMIRTATPGNRKPLEDKIAEEWKKVKDANDLEALRGFVRVFGGMFSAGAQSRLLLAEKLLATNNEDDMREAQNTLLSLRNSEDQSVAARAVEALARLFIRKGLLEDAVGLYAELNERFGKVEVRDGKTGADFYNELITDKRFLPYLEPMRQNWSPRIKAQEVTGATPYQAVAAFTIEPEGELLPFYQRYRLAMEKNFQGGGQSGLRVIDKMTGEERFRSLPLPPLNWMINYPQTNPRFAYARGHLLVLNINNMVYAFDLAERKQLWQYNLFGKTPMPNANPVNQIIEPDGGLRLVYPDGWTQKVGQVGVIEASYVCLITRDGLVALDPARGTTIWSKSNISSRVQLVGDENYIYIFEQNQDGTPSPTRVVRAMDGVAVENVPDSSALFAKSNRLKVFGRNLVVFEDKENKKSFRMHDLLTGKDLWTVDLDPRAAALRSDDGWTIGYVTSTGEIAAYDVRTGKKVFSARLDGKWIDKHLAKVNEALLLSDHEHYYVALNRPVEGNLNPQGVLDPGMRTAKVNGHLYCFDKQTSKRLWFTHDELENQAIILEQFQDLPVLLAAMYYTRINNGVFEGNQSKVVAIEKETGRLRFRREMGQNGGQFQALLTDPKAGTIELWRPDMRIRFSADDGKPVSALDAKPAPVASGVATPPPVLTK
jgi:outer membrane protein assembly factor BamB/tetratricopeptide (TPR) repeat protein